MPQMSVFNAAGYFHAIALKMPIMLEWPNKINPASCKGLIGENNS